MTLRTVFADPMVRMLVAAILFAAIVPATGSARSVAQAVANAAIFILFLLNGMRIARRDIAAGIANWRFLLPLVLWVFGAMALIGAALAALGQIWLAPSVSLGFLYLGTLPSTVQSATSYTSLARGNVALSVVGAALLNILGVFVTVPIFLALGGSGSGAVGMDVIGKIMLLLILPFAIGQALQGFTGAFIAAHKPKIAWIDRIAIAAAIYVAFSGAVEQGIWTRVDGLDWLVIAALVAAFLVAGNLGAWLAGSALRLERPDRTAFLFAGAQKSAAVGAPLATILFPPEEAGFIVIALLLYHFFQLVVAAPIANRLAQHPPADDAGCSAPTTTG
ncbi:bile acid:sodium symporter family protein [Qipengyuania profunda]|jgi:sodium/bile acid cotransporter 7|uniref:bile acid:sodium symporter family protein n=1 Tax=Qipengyuania profunda TaxID=3113984 RepID=UPI002A18872F|nr:bile acid:sodium symporter family protein [Qipengyuania sp. HL-TH1]WPL56113.1 bile acid:sodium symporter family protein [Qipengyuania sp. HL-TH5]